MVESILGFLQNQQWAILAAFVVPFIVKYFPAFSKVSNGFCAIIAALAAWCVNVFGPTPAHASGLTDALGGALSIFVPMLDTIFTKLVHDWIFNPAYKAAGLKSPSAPTPQ